MNTHIPLISIIVPVFNQEKYLGRCLRSLIKQKFVSEDFEIIVINDGSTDHSYKVAETCKNDIVYIDLKENKGCLLL